MGMYTTYIYIYTYTYALAKYKILLTVYIYIYTICLYIYIHSVCIRAYKGVRFRIFKVVEVHESQSPGVWEFRVLRL